MRGVRVTHALVWHNLNQGPAATLLCGRCATRASVAGTPARESEFLYALSRAPRCDKCGWVHPVWSESRHRQRAQERAFRVVLNAEGRDAFGRPKGGA